MPPDHTLIHALPSWQALLLLAPALPAAAAAALARPGTDVASAWLGARWAASAALLFSVLSLVAVMTGRIGAGYGVRADGVGALVSLLVAFVGWVIVRYSQTYLQGEREERHYVRWLMATLAAVSTVLVTNHMLVLTLAWLATSLALHRLLPFFGHRSAAVVAAHKKFIVGRAADGCMLMATVLLLIAFGTFDLHRMAMQGTAAPMPWTAQAAIVLVAFSALLKCAQLPFHGWLIQVMEAPTPVSALLHAGVVNLGGFVLLRFAPLVSEVPAAQVLLVMAGTATAMLAALVMTTRISIKVMLAWSTCAQMGFMLMQCGLGMWEMALLHLVAHSLYKAHAFLGAGGAVRRVMLVKLMPPAAPPGPWALASGAVIGAAMTLTAGTLFSRWFPAHLVPPAVWVLGGIVALAIVPLVNAQALRLRGLRMPAIALGAFGVALAYFGLHALFATLVPTGSVQSPVWLCGLVALGFIVLFMLQSLIAVAPQGALARGLYPWFYGGLFLDEKFSRVAFDIWPPPQPTREAGPLPGTDNRIAALSNLSALKGVTA